MTSDKGKQDILSIILKNEPSEAATRIKELDMGNGVFNIFLGIEFWKCLLDFFCYQFHVFCLRIFLLEIFFCGGQIIMPSKKIEIALTSFFQS